MAMEINSPNAICTKCGIQYSRRKGFFPVSYALLHKGIGYIPVCKECIDNLYNSYLSICNDSKSAVRQVCRKLDLYWNENAYNYVERKNTARSMMTSYITRINGNAYIGKSYDDTLSEEGSLWCLNESNSNDDNSSDMNNIASDCVDEEDIDFDITEEIVAFWGSGYTPQMYKELEQRRTYWMSRYPKDLELDIGTEALIRQICNLEIDINRARVAGKSIDKNVNALNNLLGSASLKPAQKKEENKATLDSVPFGVGIGWCEKHKPITDPSPEFEDVDGVIKYITTWVLGHMAKMLKKKNLYSKLYEDEIKKLRVERPEYDDLDDENFFNEVFSDSSDAV